MSSRRSPRFRPAEIGKGASGIEGRQQCPMRARLGVVALGPQGRERLAADPPPLRLRKCRVHQDVGRQLETRGQSRFKHLNET